MSFLALAGTLTLAFALTSCATPPAATGSNPSSTLPIPVSTDAATHAKIPLTPVSLKLDGCSPAWPQPHPGLQQFALTNDAGRPMEVSLNSVPQQNVFSDIDGLGPNTTRVITVNIPAGDYQFRCMPEDADAIAGSTVHIAAQNTENSGADGKKYEPNAKVVTFQDLVDPSKNYQAWIESQLGVLAGKTDALNQSVQAGDLNAAKERWLDAHSLYETLGAAYDAFGDADGAINGNTAGLPKGIEDPDFWGFHALESALWKPQQPLAHNSKELAAQLTKDTGALRDSFAQERVDPLLIGLRAHEIMENAIQFELSGRNDYGSHTTLQTVQSNLSGTDKLLGFLSPVLTPRLPQFPQIQDQLHATSDTVQNAIDHHIVPGQSPRADQQDLNSSVSALTESLADVAAAADIRRTQ